ncbi:MAG: alpha/beta hydrolase [Planctomycetes bacterium]|nr:alpha/beta hydrolase [Planctomycetota bacterium]
MVETRDVLAGWISVITLLIATGTVIAAEPPVVALWPDGAPGETGEIQREAATVSGDPPVTRINNVTEPTIQLYSAPADNANGCAVVICPGGGYNILAYDKEGTEVAEWLNSLGVTAVVLKYRVPRRDKQQPHLAPLQDVQRAIRLTRQNADAWQIDPARVGVLGFSAGGHLTVMAGTHWNDTTYPAVDDADRLSCRPDFLVPIYPAYLGDEENPGRLSPLVQVTKDTPPTFMAITYDDKDRAIYAALLLIELKRASVPAELHIYSKGGHGYGLRPSDNPVCHWPERCEDWLRVSGLLQASDQR